MLLRRVAAQLQALPASASARSSKPPAGLFAALIFPSFTPDLSTPDMWWYVGAVAVVTGVGLYGAYRCDRRDAAERDEKTTSARSSDDDRP
jgi:hypothetical protein